MQQNGTAHYWRGNAEVREDLAAAIRDLGYDFVVVRTLEEVLDLHVRGKISLLVVDATAGEREASGRALEIAHTEALRQVSVLFVAPQAEQRVTPIRNNFRRVFPLNVPYNLSHLEWLMPKLATGAECTPDDIVRLQGDMPVSPAASVSQAESPSAGEAAAASAPRRQRQTVEGNSEENRRRLVPHRNPAALRGTYGGEVFAIASELSDFADEYLFPNSPAGTVLRRELDQLSDTDQWAALQTRRSAFLATALATHFAFRAEDAETFRIAMTALNRNFAGPGAGRLLRRYDLIGQCEQEFVTTILETFVASAEWVEAELQQPEAGLVIQRVVELLQFRAPPGDRAALDRIAQCVAGIELAVRAAWGGGYWNPYGAYRMICGLRRANSVITDPEVTLALCRVLGEACSAHSNVGNFVHVDVDAGDLFHSLFSESSRAAEVVPYVPPRGVRVTSVPLADLVPGMRTAQPIRARDGRTVLHSSVRLNRELILQLWQLCAIRSLDRTVSVYREQ